MRFPSPRGRARMSGAWILLQVRNRTANTWPDLCRTAGLEPDQFDTLHSILMQKLEALKDAGLVDFKLEDDGSSWAPRIEGEITVAKSWEGIRTALDISLVGIADLGSDDALIVRPFWGRPADAAQRHDLFVLMPFAQAMRPVYDDHIKQVASGLSLTVGRADDFSSAHSVIADVWSGISGARVVVADCTGRNPNVFYEIGLAHVLGRPVVLITQSPDDVPFDVKHIRFIHYTFTPRGMTDFEKALDKTIRGVLAL